MRIQSARRTGRAPAPSGSDVRYVGGYARGGGSSGSNAGPRGAAKETAAMRARVVIRVAAETGLTASAEPHETMLVHPAGANGEWQGAWPSERCDGE
jgi:hypothetical protein